MNQNVVSRLGEYVRPTGEEAKLRISFPDEPPRITVGTRAAVIAAGIVAVITALLLAYTFFRSNDAAVAPPMPAELAGAAGAEVSGGEDTIVVSVVGAVVVQGLVTLEPGSRVADAIAAAGGVLEGADPAGLNHAQLLVDGQQIVVPAAGAPVGDAAPISSAVSLNSADAATLTTLDGVGEVTAAAIVKYREEHSGFTSVEQLLEVTGIGPAKFEAIKDQVTL